MDFNTLPDAALKACLKDANLATHHGEITKILAVRTAKPAYTFRPKFNAKGGLVMPMVVYRNSAEEVIKIMQGLLADARWQNYSK